MAGQTRDSERQEREMRGESCTDRKGGDATCSEKAMQAGPHRGGAKSFFGRCDREDDPGKGIFTGRGGRVAAPCMVMAWLCAPKSSCWTETGTADTDEAPSWIGTMLC